jgi:hypothetical protein
VDVTLERWTALREELVARFDALASCAWLGGALSRNALSDVVEACLPDPIPIGEFAFANAALRDLLAEVLENDGTPRLPDHPAALFQPIETFDPERHCHRPWELERLLAFLETIADSCASCVDDPSVSPCCGGAP